MLVRCNSTVHWCIDPGVVREGSRLVVVSFGDYVV